MFIWQNESLNGGGMLFVNKHPDLKVCVVHGNTLTAAVILNKIPQDVDEVFLTGSTSKLGRAIALYLARRRVRVLVRSAWHLLITVGISMEVLDSFAIPIWKCFCYKNHILVPHKITCAASPGKADFCKTLMNIIYKVISSYS